MNTNQNTNFNDLSQNFAQAGQAPKKKNNFGRGQRKISATQQAKEFGEVRQFSSELINDLVFLIQAMQNSIAYYQAKTKDADGHQSRFQSIIDRVLADHGLNDGDLKYLRTGFFKTPKNKTQCQKHLRAREVQLLTVHINQIDMLLHEDHINKNLFKDEQEKFADKVLGLSESNQTTQEAKNPVLNVSIDQAMKTLTDVIKSQQDQLDAQAQIIAELTERMNQVEELSVYAAQELQNRFTI